MGAILSWGQAWGVVWPFLWSPGLRSPQGNCSCRRQLACGCCFRAPAGLGQAPCRGQSEPSSWKDSPHQVPGRPVLGSPRGPHGTGGNRLGASVPCRPRARGAEQDARPVSQVPVTAPGRGAGRSSEEGAAQLEWRAFPGARMVQGLEGGPSAQQLTLPEPAARWSRANQLSQISGLLPPTPPLALARPPLCPGGGGRPLVLLTQARHSPWRQRAACGSCVSHAGPGQPSAVRRGLFVSLEAGLAAFPEENTIFIK